MVVIQNQIVGKKLSVTDELLLLNPYQTPMVNALGFSTPAGQVEHQWFEDEMFADQTTAGADAAVAATSLTVADGSIFQARDVIKVGSELLLVTAVAANVLTVTRGYAGTTAAAITTGALVEFQFVEGVEGADARASRYKARVRKSNLTQIFDGTISLSGTAIETSQYSIEDFYEYEKQKKIEELALQLEKAIINGIKYESTDGKVRQMAGIRQMITTNVIDGGGQLVSYDDLADLFQSVWEAGGYATGANYKLVVSAKQKRNISGISQVVIERKDNVRGTVADFFISDFGEAEIVVNNNLQPGEVYLLDFNRMDIRPLGNREFSHTFLGHKGDYVEGQIVGEYTFELHQEKAHARVTNLG